MKDVLARKSDSVARQLIEQAQYEAITDCIQQVETVLKRLREMQSGVDPDRAQAIAVEGPYMTR